MAKKVKTYLLVQEQDEGEITTKRLTLQDIIERYSSHISQKTAFVVDGSIIPFNQLKRKYRDTARAS